MDGMDMDVKDKPEVKEEKCARNFISFTDDKVGNCRKGGQG